MPGPLPGRYLEQERGLVLAAGSLAVEFAASQHHMHIDHASMQSLELVQPLKVGSKSTRRGVGSLLRCGGWACQGWGRQGRLVPFAVGVG